ncbi:MAG: hypothetical protein IJ567_07030 [Lachnospiraceae bacterium]|nr:hypothetical protein [Lachnospiraceae bacterium]
MEISNNQSWYINPNNRTVTSNIKNTAVKDWKTVKETMFDEMEPVEDLIATIKIPLNLAESTSVNKVANSVNLAIGAKIRINDGYVLTVKTHGVELSHTEDYNPYDQKAYLKAEQMSGSLASLLRNAGGTRTRLYHTEEAGQGVMQGITNVLSYLGIDTGKDFYVNGMKYSTNSKGYFESEATTEAQAAYERQQAANRTYEFADEKTRKQIAYMSDYYLSTTPEDVKDAWQATLEETGINPFPNGYASTLAQLSVEQDFQTGGNNNIFGDTLESSIAAVESILERIDNPLEAMKESDYANLENEKEFYSALLENLQKYNSDS